MDGDAEEVGVGNESSFAATGPSPGSSFDQVNHDVERLLSERLLQGFCLLERACPSCATPLVKQDPASAAIIDKYNLRKSHSDSTCSTTGTLQPVPGVAYCVKCQAHVVTSAEDMEILESRQQLRGQILIGNDANLTYVVPAEEPSSGDLGAQTVVSEPKPLHRHELEYHGQSDTLNLSGTASTASSLLKVGSFHLHQARARRQHLRQFQLQKASNYIDVDQEDNSTISTAPDHRSDKKEQLQRQWEIQQARVNAVLQVQRQSSAQDRVVMESDSSSTIQEGTVVGTITSVVTGRSVADEEEEDAKIQVGIVLRTQSSSNESQEPKIDSPIHRLQKSSNQTMDLEEIEVIHYDEDISLLENQTLQTYEERTQPIDARSSTHEEKFSSQEIAQNNSKCSNETFIDEVIKRSEAAEVSANDSRKVPTPATLHHDFPLPGYTARRELAIKILAGKLVHGYNISRNQCDFCSMPLMEKESNIQECYVCQALRKRHQKKNCTDSVQVSAEEAQRRVLELAERVGRQHCAAISKSADAISEQERLDSLDKQSDEARHDTTEEGANTMLSHSPDTHDEWNAQQLAPKENHEAPGASTLNNEDEQIEVSFAESGKEPDSEESHFSIRQAYATTQSNTEIASESESGIKESSNRPILELLTVDAAPHPEKAQHFGEESQHLDPREEKLVELIAVEKQRVLDETKRLEGLEKRSAQPPPKGIQILQFLEEEAELKKAMDEAIQARNNAENEVRRLSDEKRMLEEERMLTELEREASEKQKMAEEAMTKAQSALESIKDRRQKMGTFSNDAKAKSGASAAIGPSSADLFRERWTILRAEGRSVMTRRLIAGWTLLDESCQGIECHNFLLLFDGTRRLCAVCGGSGNGTDGVYTASNTTVSQERMVPVPMSPTETKSLKELQKDFDTKRDMVSTEIGKRMMKGWTLLDMTCPRCVMPLMTDKIQKSEICVLCGPVGTISRRAPFASQQESSQSVAKTAKLKSKRSSAPTKNEKNPSRSRSKSPSKRVSSRSRNSPKLSSSEHDQPQSRSKEKASPSRVPSKDSQKKDTRDVQDWGKSSNSAIGNVELAVSTRNLSPSKAHKARARSVSPWKSVHSVESRSAASRPALSNASPTRLAQWQAKVTEHTSSPFRKRKESTVLTLIQQMEQKLYGKWVKKAPENELEADNKTIGQNNEDIAKVTESTSTPVSSPDLKNYEWKWDPFQKAWTTGSPKKFNDSPMAASQGRKHSSFSNGVNKPEGRGKHLVPPTTSTAKTNSVPWERELKAQLSSAAKAWCTRTPQGLSLQAAEEEWSARASPSVKPAKEVDVVIFHKKANERLRDDDLSNPVKCSEAKTKEDPVVSQYEAELQRVLKRMQPASAARGPNIEKPLTPWKPKGGDHTAAMEEQTTKPVAHEKKELIKDSFEDQLRSFLDRKAKEVDVQMQRSQFPDVPLPPTASLDESEDELEDAMNKVSSERSHSNDSDSASATSIIIEQPDHFETVLRNNNPIVAERASMEVRNLSHNAEYPYWLEATISSESGTGAANKFHERLLLEPDRYDFQERMSAATSRPARSDPPAPNASFDGFHSARIPAGPPARNGSFDALNEAQQRNSSGTSGSIGALERLRASRRSDGRSRDGPPAPNGSSGACRSRGGPLSPGGVRVVDLREAIDQLTNDLDDVVMLEFPPFDDNCPITQKSQKEDQKASRGNSNAAMEPDDHRSYTDSVRNIGEDNAHEHRVEENRDPAKSVIYIEESMMLKSPPSSTPQKIDVVLHRKVNAVETRPPTECIVVPRKKNEVLMLEVPKSLDINGRRAIQRLIEAAATESEGLEVNTKLKRVGGDVGRKHSSSPGISAAPIPSGLPSLSSNMSGVTGNESKGLGSNHVMLPTMSSAEHLRRNPSLNSARQTERRAPSPGISAARATMPHSPMSCTTGMNSGGKSSCVSEGVKALTESAHPGKRAPSPGISMASVPMSRQSDVYASSSNASNMSGSGRPRITPETQARSRSRKSSSQRTGSTSKRSQSGRSHRSTQASTASDRESSHGNEYLGTDPTKSAKSLKHKVDLASKSRESPIIDVERLRKSNWREGRDEVIIVDTAKLAEEKRVKDDANASTIDAILSRIEQTKSQLEQEPSRDPAEGNPQSRLTGLIENLSEAANEMDRIERASSDYRY